MARRGLELRVHSATAVPDDHVVSFSAGGARRQAPLEKLRKSPVNFPNNPEQSSEPILIEVMKVVASQTLSLQQGQAEYPVQLGGDSASGGAVSSKCSVKVSVRPQGSGAGASHDQSVESHDEEKYNGKASMAKDYLEETGVMKYFQAMLQSIMQERPPDPYSFMLQQLDKSCPEGCQSFKEPEHWVYQPINGLSASIRATPDIGGEPSGYELEPGEKFFVSKTQTGADGVLFLKLADGRGWFFDQKPSVGRMCVKVAASRKPPLPPPAAAPGPAVPEAAAPLAAPVVAQVAQAAAPLAAPVVAQVAQAAAPLAAPAVAAAPPSSASPAAAEVACGAPSLGAPAVAEVARGVGAAAVAPAESQSTRLRRRLRQALVKGSHSGELARARAQLQPAPASAQHAGQHRSPQPPPQGDAEAQRRPSLEPPNAEPEWAPKFDPQARDAMLQGLQQAWQLGELEEAFAEVLGPPPPAKPAAVSSKPAQDAKRNLKALLESACADGGLQSAFESQAQSAPGVGTEGTDLEEARSRVAHSLQAAVAGGSGDDRELGHSDPTAHLKEKVRELLESTYKSGELESALEAASAGDVSQPPPSQDNRRAIRTRVRDAFEEACQEEGRLEAAFKQAMSQYESSGPLVLAADQPASDPEGPSLTQPPNASTETPGQSDDGIRLTSEEWAKFQEAFRALRDDNRRLHQQIAEMSERVETLSQDNKDLCQKLNIQELS